MHEIRVNLTSGGYPIRIEPASLECLGPTLRSMGARGTVALVTNSTVDRLYGAPVCRGIRKAGLSTLRLRIPEGERYKTLRTVRRLYDQFIEHRLERQSFLVALGGGVVGDVAGFAAATYLRGIPLVQVPTTLVAQVDASIGGKTGVDHPGGKNLIGAFYQPRLVFIDPGVLGTLKGREYRAGLAEVVKYGVIADGDLFSDLEKAAERILAREPDPVVRLIVRCSEIKAKVVEQDERESGVRRILNFGHTLGHALETWGGYRKYLHGEAVSIGMVSAARMALLLGLLSQEEVGRLMALLSRFGLPVSLPNFRVADILKIIAVDKKVAQGKIQFILPEHLGRVTVRGLDL